MPKYVVIHEPAETDTEVRYFFSQIQAFKFFTSLPGHAFIAAIMDEKKEGT